MKLKKIASLMLAGVMAVSMLAGCSTGSNGGNNGNEGEGEGEGTATGYSAMLGAAVSDKVKDMDYVTFADNNTDQTALAAASAFVSDKVLENWVKENKLEQVTMQDAMLSAFEDKAELDREPETGLVDGGKFFNNWQPLNDRKVGEVWVANSTVDLDVVMDKIFDKYKAEFEALDDSYTIDDTNLKVDVDYSYVVSVSVVNVPVRSNLEFNGSVNLVAVTVTRSGEIA